MDRSEILINKLIDNSLDPKELDELILGLQNVEEREKYSEALQKYFESLLEKSNVKEE